MDHWEITNKTLDLNLLKFLGYTSASIKEVELNLDIDNRQLEILCNSSLDSRVEHGTEGDETPTENSFSSDYASSPNSDICSSDLDPVTSDPGDSGLETGLQSATTSRGDAEVKDIHRTEGNSAHDNGEDDGDVPLFHVKSPDMSEWVDSWIK